jgi:hypothetical protein
MSLWTLEIDQASPTFAPFGCRTLAGGCWLAARCCSQPSRVSYFRSRFVRPPAFVHVLAGREGRVFAPWDTVHRRWQGLSSALGVAPCGLRLTLLRIVLCRVLCLARRSWLPATLRCSRQPRCGTARPHHNEAARGESLFQRLPEAI